jgi:arylsulfatase A-like enzyme
MKLKSFSNLSGFLLFSMMACQPQVKQPNIIYILADDLGYGDLSCFGQKHFSTPNIDKLASEGMLFTQHYAGTSVCSPSRSSLMTGMNTGHTPIRGNKDWGTEGQWPMDSAACTLAEMLKSAGYLTGGFGKWGLGFFGTEGEPKAQGFDEFFGFNCQRLAHNYFPSHLWDNRKKVELKGNVGDAFGEYAPEIIHQRALQFIKKNKGKPFFLYYSTTIPHAELLLPEKHLAEFRGKFLPEKKYDGSLPGDTTHRTGGLGFRLGSYGYQEECHAAFASMVTLLDKHVGEVVAKLKELGLDKNTIVIFSSDNGPHVEGGADPDYFDSNGALRGYKRDLYEGGIRVPMVAWCPGKIKAGSKTDHISAFWDIMPTFAELAGITPPDNIQGISFLPTLFGEPGQKEHEYMYWEFHEQRGKQAVREGKWKAVKLNASTDSLNQDSIELYDLFVDIGEQHNIAADHLEIVEQMRVIMKKEHAPSEIFPFAYE